ncbi:MAG: type III-B CRISPR module RAMP protein Cmr6 [Acidobacteriota bacterium]
MSSDVPLPRPLYRSVGPERWEPTGHAGLWYDKFCNAWRAPQGKRWTDADVDKLAWIKTVTRKVGEATLLSEHLRRQRNMVTALGGSCLEFTTESRFVTGLGREHPVENGFAWHAILGTPYLPGSSVKGIVRAWAREEAEEGIQNRILGQHERVGRVVLLDALPLQPVQLEADVMTPHYAAYYQSDDPDRDPPGDWMSPIPIPFLVVAANQRFQFAMVPKTPKDVSHLPTVETWLHKALAWLGGGAKTAVGYGRFVRSDKLAPADSASGPAQTTAISAPAGTRRSRYEAGTSVLVKRVEDPRGKNRPWFQADDGFGGTIVRAKADEVPDIAIGQTIRLEVAAALNDGYNFRLPRQEKEDPSPRKGPGNR